MNNSKVIFIFFIFFYSLGISQENNDLVEGKDEGDRRENLVSGNIFIGDNLLSKGKVYLVSKSKSISTTSFYSDVLEGVFMFDNFKFSNYSLYVIPEQNYDFFYFPKYLPTYLGDVCNWENASINDTKISTANVDIHMQKYSEPFYGHAEISGNITYERNTSIEKNIPIVIFLLNNKKEPMDFRLADDFDGSFKFENLPDGKYFIHPEIPGYYTYDSEIIVKEKHIHNRIDFRINNNSIEQDVLEEEQIKPIVLEDGLRFKLSENVTEPIVCEITDLAGRVILKEKFSSNEIFISTSNLTTGIYLLRARTFTNSIVKTTKVFINNK